MQVSEGDEKEPVFLPSSSAFSLRVLPLTPPTLSRQLGIPEESGGRSIRAPPAACWRLGPGRAWPARGLKGAASGSFPGVAPPAGWRSPPLPARTFWLLGRTWKVCWGHVPRGCEEPCSVSRDKQASWCLILFPPAWLCFPVMPRSGA